MNFNRDTMLGLVFFGGLLLIGSATFWMTRLSFEPKPEMTVRFAHAQGLRKGDPVYVLGKRMGIVSKVAWTPSDPDAPISVDLELDEVITLHPDRQIEISDASLLGGSQVDIDPGTEKGAARPPHRGENKLGPLADLGGADLSGTVASIKRFFDQLVDPEGSIGALLSERNVYDDLTATLATARRVAESIETGDGTITRLIRSKQMADDLEGAVGDIRQATRSLNEGPGLLPRLLTDDQMADDVAVVLQNFRNVSAKLDEGDGLVPRLLNDGQLADDVSATLVSFRSISGKIDDPDAGLLGAVIGNTQMREDGQALMANVRSITEKIDEGRGLLAKLINDPELGERVERLFTQVTGAIEDAREAAPVGTFLQVLAGPF